MVTNSEASGVDDHKDDHGLACIYSLSVEKKARLDLFPMRLAVDGSSSQEMSN